MESLTVSAVNNTVPKNDNGKVYTFRNETGSAHLTEYRVFDGVKLVYRDVHMRRYTAASASERNIIEIDHCREGRFEQRSGKHYYYLSQGDLSVNRSFGGEAEICFPTGHYHGVSVIIDTTIAEKGMGGLIREFGVDPKALSSKFLGHSESFIIRSTERLEHIFSELYTVPESIRNGYFKVKIIELMLFLSSIDTSSSVPLKQGCSRTQVQLAKDVCSFVCENMGTRFTIDQLADQFGVSPTQLKNSFRSVYGESVYAYVRAQKMRSAAKLLRDTDRTVLDIAGECGYDNGSKFSKAFAEVMGMTPSEFRRSGAVISEI